MLPVGGNVRHPTLASLNDPDTEFRDIDEHDQMAASQFSN